MPGAVQIDLSVLSTLTRFRGIGRYVRDLALALDGLEPEVRGFELQALTDVGRWWSRPSTARNVSATVAGFDASRRSGPHRPWARRMRARLPKVSRSLPCDLLHLGNPDAAPGLPLRVPTVLTCHDLIPLRYPEEYARRLRNGFEGQLRLEMDRYLAAAHVIAVSEAAAHDLVHFLKLPVDRVTIVHNGIDLDRWTPAPAPKDAAALRKFELEDRPYVLYVGAGDWRKNVHRMLQALLRARQQPGSAELELVWAGHLSREHLRSLRRWVSDLGLDGAVHHLDYVSDDELESLYRGARATILVSLAEGFGYPVVEAMASGCPVVTSQGTSTEEIAGDAALIVDPLNVEAMAEALSTLAHDARERARLGERGLVQASRFGRATMAENTAAVFRDLL